jgi:hypothetical protein
MKWLPQDTSVGTSWTIDKDQSALLLTRFYPTTENNDLSANRLDQQSLRGTVLSLQGGIARARIDGSLRMKHAFYPHRDDNNFVEATIVGYMDFELKNPRIHSLRLVTDKATYPGEKQHFGVALRTIPPSRD